MARVCAVRAQCSTTVLGTAAAVTRELCLVRALRLLQMPQLRALVAVVVGCRPV